MPSFDVTLSALTKAAADIRTQTGDFKQRANETLQAAQTLGEGWEGGAYQEFLTSVQDLQKWMSQMGEVLDTYSKALETAKQTYEQADAESAKGFGRG